MSDHERRADSLLREVVLGVERELGRWLTPGSSREMLCRVHRAAGEAAEVVRILELHRRTGGLAYENLAALEKNRRIYEVSERILARSSSRPEDPTPGELESFFEVTEDI